MQTQKHYNKAPITEAIIDFRVTLPEGLTIERLKDIYAVVSDQLPTMEPFYRGIGAISYKPGSSFEVNASEQQIGFWFRSEDNLHTLQASLEGFTFNRLAPYESWDSFSTDAKTYWKAYKKICEPIQITRISVRFVNQLNIPIAQPIELKDYLKTMPEASPLLPQNAVQAFYMQLQIPQYDLDSMLVINEAIAPPIRHDTVSVILDIDLFRQQVWEGDEREVWDFLEQLHVRKNEVFEASITDKTRELIS
jgi:uncharacterized protein (TIGR04255 family)